MPLKRSRLLLGVVLIVIILLVSILGLSHLGDTDDGVPGELTPLDSPSSPQRGFFMGVLPTPADGQSFDEAYVMASESCEFVPVWGKPSPFYNLPDDLEGSWGETFVDQYTRGNGMFPLVHFSFIDAGMTLKAPPGIDDASLSDEEWRDAYRTSVLEVVRVARPLYLSIGNEVNRWYEEYGADVDDENGFQHFVSLYNEIYDEVKAISNQTIVFCTFAREMVSELREADLDVLEFFDSDRMDLLVMTSYPHAVQGINSPQDIEDDYYSEAVNRMPGKAFGFSEIAWPSMYEFGGEQAQADFLNASIGRLTTGQGMELHMIAWSWLHDIDDNDETGLVDRDGSPKLAYGAWMDISSSVG
ncbi:MAG: hypothetical protein OEM29_07705 [Thermoplasmata archaeon]|nr:hypothetical protein [Thermoplasmata archaeon]